MAVDKNEVQILDALRNQHQDVTGTVLIVDDNEDIRDVTRTMLEAFTQFQVITAANGREALDILALQSVDVIILDENMPEMNGTAFFGVIRQKNIHTPVIFLTGKVVDSNRSMQLSLGAFDYLAKPIHARDLIVLVYDAFKANERIRGMLKRRAF